MLVKLRASKDELSTFKAETSKEKKAMEAKFDVAFEVSFNYGYGCCAFEHNIYGSKLGIPNVTSGTSQPLSLEFFVNPRCPPDVVLAGGCCCSKGGH